MSQLITSMRSVLCESASLQYQGSKFLWLYLRAVARILFLFSEVIVVPTPYGKLARALISIFDFVEPQVQSFFHENITDARVFIDVGAYHRWYTLKASRIR